MTGSMHRWTVLAPACLLLVIALAACGLGSGKPDGPGAPPHPRRAVMARRPAPRPGAKRPT